MTLSRPSGPNALRFTSDATRAQRGSLAAEMLLVLADHSARMLARLGDPRDQGKAKLLNVSEAEWQAMARTNLKNLPMLEREVPLSRPLVLLLAFQGLQVYIVNLHRAALRNDQQHDLVPEAARFFLGHDAALDHRSEQFDRERFGRAVGERSGALMRELYGVNWGAADLRAAVAEARALSPQLGLEHHDHTSFLAGIFPPA